MLGQDGFPGVGPVDGMHDSPDSADQKNELERKKMLARAQADERAIRRRAIRRQAIVDITKKALEDKVDPMEKMRRIAMFVSNLHGEVFELWEACRKNSLDAPCDKADKMSQPLTCAEEELVDIVICVFDTAVTLGIDIENAIAVKSEYNKVDHLCMER